MATTGRKFRFIRKTARTQWYLGPWMYGSFIVSTVMLVFLLGVQRSFVAWLVCAGWIALLGWRWRQMHRRESEFWGDRKGLLVWLEDGYLHVSSDGKHLPDPLSLSDVRAIDALEEKGKIVRLLVDKADGVRTTYAGFDDMEAFAVEFKLNAPQAKFRRVRFGFPMKLKEV